MKIGIDGETVDREIIYQKIVEMRKYQHQLKKQNVEVKAKLESLAGQDILDKIDSLKTLANIRSINEFCDGQARILEKVLKQMKEFKSQELVSERIVKNVIYASREFNGCIILDDAYYYY